MYPGKYLHVPLKHSPLPEHLLGHAPATPSDSTLPSGVRAVAASSRMAAAPPRRQRSHRAAIARVEKAPLTAEGGTLYMLFPIMGRAAVHEHVVYSGVEYSGQACSVHKSV